MSSVENSTDVALRLLEQSRAKAAQAERPRETTTPRNTLLENMLMGGERKASEPDARLLKDLSAKVNFILDALGKSLRFSVHDATKRIVVSVVDDNTGEVVREIPATKFLDMVSKLEDLTGFIMDERV